MKEEDDREFFDYIFIGAIIFAFLMFCYSLLP